MRRKFNWMENILGCSRFISPRFELQKLMHPHEHIHKWDFKLFPRIQYHFCCDWVEHWFQLFFDSFGTLGLSVRLEFAECVSDNVKLMWNNMQGLQGSLRIRGFACVNTRERERERERFRKKVDWLSYFTINSIV